MTQDLSGLHYETQESQNKIITDLGLSTSVIIHSHFLTAAWLAQLGECRSAEREAVSSNPGRTNTQGLKNN